MFKNYFKFQTQSVMLKNLYNVNGKKNNDLLVRIIKSGLIDLKNEIKKMSKDETKNEKPYEIVEIVENILEFNQLKQQQGHVLKNLTPNQMLSRLPISLAQLKAGNNSEKLKNEIRQLMYSLYRSKNLQNKCIKV